MQCSCLTPQPQPDSVPCMTEPFRVGVAGVGAIGRNHARILSELARNSGGSIQFTAIYDTDLARAQELAAQFQSRAVSDLEAFAQRVDAATVAVPTIAHRQLGGYLLERGKHVLIEKPISDSLEEAQELVKLADEHNVILQVGHIERFNPVMRELEQRMTQPKFIDCTRLSPYPGRSLDVGVVLDVMIHDLEIILHLVKSPWEQVDAVGVAVLSKREDIANVRIRFANGCVANITASRISQDKVRKIRVFQQDAYLSLDYQKQEGHILRLAEGSEKESTLLGKLFGLAADSTIVTEYAGRKIVREPVPVEKDEPLKLELAAFVDCARQGTRPVVSGQEGTAALALALKITEQINANLG
jgi:predicted dehydrogenase